MLIENEQMKVELEAEDTTVVRNEGAMDVVLGIRGV
jgi:hypothetical protein